MKKSLYAIALLVLMSASVTACTKQSYDYGGQKQSDSHGGHRH